MPSAARLAVRPPEYFPGVAYAAMMLAVDVFVLADTWQYVRQSHQNRSRIRNPDGVQWLTVPIVGAQFGLPASRVRIDEETDWRSRHLKALRFNYGATPFFHEYIKEIEKIIGAQYSVLSQLTMDTVRFVAKAIHTDSRLKPASEWSSEAESLLAVVARFPGARVLVSGEYDREEVPLSNVFDPEIVPWRQQFSGFSPDVSVLDLLFNYGPDARRYLVRLAESAI